MQNIEKGGDGITSHFTDFGLFYQSLVELRRGILLLLFWLTTFGLFAVSLLLGGGNTWNVEAHLDELVFSSGRLLAFGVNAVFGFRSSVVAILRQGHLDGDLVAASQVGVANLGVGQLKRRAVLHAECDFRLCKLGLAPVPAAQGVLLLLKRSAVPILENLAEAVVIALLEAVELDDAGITLHDANFVALGSSAPLRAANVAVVERERVSAGVGLPAEAGLCESAFSAILGEVQEDVVEALAAVEEAVSMHSFEAIARGGSESLPR